MATQPLIINNWSDGIGDSPDQGFALIQNASIDAVPGTLQPNYQQQLVTFPAATSTFTWNVSGTCNLTTSGTSLETDGVPVTFSTAGGGSLDTNITAGVVYFLYKFATGRVIITTSTGAALSHTPTALAGNGSGTCTVTVVNPGTINSMCKDTNGIVYGYDSNGRVWYGNDGGASQFYLLNGNTTTNSAGTGISAFTVSDKSATYIFCFASSRVDVCNVTTQAFRRDPVGNSAWSNSWQTNMNNGSGYTGSHQSILGYDNITYACDGRYIVSIQEVPGQIFAPGTGATYAWNPKALTLPSVATAQCLEQLSINLLVGDLNTNQIYPWDRTSPSFSLPIICNEIGVYGMRNIGNTVFILNGTRGNIYSTLGYFVTPVRKIPEHLTMSTGGGSNVVTWGAASSKNGALLFGLQGLSGIAGQFMLFPDGRLVQDNTPSQGSLLPTAMVSQAGEFYWIGYAGGIDATVTNRYYNLATSLAISKLYVVGTKVGQSTFSLLEVQLDQPGASGGQVRISYRTDTTSAFTVLATYTLDGTTTSFDTDIGLTGIQNIQIKAEVASAPNGVSGTGAARVKEVRLLAGSH